MADPADFEREEKKGPPPGLPTVEERLAALEMDVRINERKAEDRLRIRQRSHEDEMRRMAEYLNHDTSMILAKLNKLEETVYYKARQHHELRLETEERMFGLAMTLKEMGEWLVGMMDEQFPMPPRYQPYPKRKDDEEEDEEEDDDAPPPYTE
jgi:hypothetical protein